MYGIYGMVVPYLLPYTYHNICDYCDIVGYSAGVKREEYEVILTEPVQQWNGNLDTGSWGSHALSSRWIPEHRAVKKLRL